MMIYKPIPMSFLMLIGDRIIYALGIGVLPSMIIYSDISVIEVGQLIKN